MKFNFKKPTKPLKGKTERLDKLDLKVGDTLYLEKYTVYHKGLGLRQYAAGYLMRVQCATRYEVTLTDLYFDNNDKTVSPLLAYGIKARWYHRLKFWLWWHFD